MNRNMGIAYALEYAKNLSQAEGFEWLYTFDQDSIIAQDYAEELLKIDDGVKSDVAMVCPLIEDKEMKMKLIIEQATSYISTAITSGAALKLSNVKELNFDTSLFIDYVDYDMCLKIMNSGQKILQNNRVQLKHSIGNHSNILGIYTSNHDALRRYYMFRNRIYLIRKYFRSNTLWTMRELLRYPTEICKIILFENKKIEKITMGSIGIIDGIYGKMGMKDD